MRDFTATVFFYEVGDDLRDLFPPGLRNRIVAVAIACGKEPHKFIAEAMRDRVNIHKAELDAIIQRETPKRIRATKTTKIQ